MLFDTAGVGGWEGFSLHGFTLRASPAVTHGVSPPGTVGEHGGSLLFSTCPLCSALHPHPRLRMVCPRRGQWVSTEEVCFFPLVLYALRCILTRGYAWCVPAGDRGCVRRRIPPCISCTICGQLSHTMIATQSRSRAACLTPLRP